MFIGKKIIYLELQKTGCSHVIKVLETAPSCDGVVYGKHNTIYEVPKEILGDDFAAKIKAGNIRNPWDWYVSLWAFGSMHIGALQGRLTSGLYKKLKKPWIFFIPHKKWRYVYSDPKNPELFRQWLKMIHAKKHKYDIGEGYGKTRLSEFAGLLSYRYLDLYTYDFHEAKKYIKTYDELVAFDRQKNMLDFTIRNETLEKDLKQVLLKIDIPLGEIEALLNTSKTNPSVRNEYQQYYDDETRDLVYEREKFLVEKYNYRY